MGMRTWRIERLEIRSIPLPFCVPIIGNDPLWYEWGTRHALPFLSRWRLRQKPVRRHVRSGSNYQRTRTGLRELFEFIVKVNPLRLRDPISPHVNDVWVFCAFEGKDLSNLASGEW